MLNAENFYRILVVVVFGYIGLKVVIKGKFTGKANNLPGLGKGIYNNGRPYFKIKGNYARAIGIFFIILAIYALIVR
ncbi:MAG: hypothetical protein O2871_03380 [bacterium]|nr:hypothetical protein [bacterium]